MFANTPIDIYKNYFKLRNVDPTYYQNYKIPSFLIKALPNDKNVKVLDIGCGFGHMLLGLRNLGYNNLHGLDISEEAISHCLHNDLNVEKINNIIEYSQLFDNQKYYFIIMSHVLEHIDKEYIIPTLKAIRDKLLAPGGQMAIMVPNAQSNTGSYWAYEDFTHTTLFTSGSLQYVLKAAGFDSISFLDPYCLQGLTWFKRLLKTFLLKVYINNINFWNRITSSSYHNQSPMVFSFEIKVIAKNN